MLCLENKKNNNFLKYINNVLIKIMKSSVLVTDGEKRIALILIRSLGRKGLKIDVGSESFFSIGFSSKYCHKKTVYKDPKHYPEKFLEYLVKILNRKKFDCIFPVREHTTGIISKYKEELSRYTNVPVPDYNIFLKAYDKETSVKIAQDKKIPCANTFFKFDINKIKEILGYPVVIKSSIKHGVGIAICNSSDELVQKYKQMVEKHGKCFLQDFIPNGGEIGVYTIFNKKSEPVALSVQKRIRTIYPYGGVSILRETIKNDKIVDIAFKYLKALKWFGPAMVEFKVDARSNKAKFMEINPRWWGSISLSVASGINFPYILYKMAKNDDIEPNLNYKVGVKCRSFYGDILWYFKSKNKLKNLSILFDFKTNLDILSLTDPIPMFIAPITLAREVLTK